MSGTFQPGEPLVEPASAERYEVSRTPIRKTLRQSLSEGLAEQFARGYRMKKHSPEDILDTYEVRIALAAAARAAALRHTAFRCRQVMARPGPTEVHD